MHSAISRKPIVAAALALATACGGPPRPPAWTPPAHCEFLSAPPRAADTLTVALTEPVDPRYAPWPRNASEALVFRHCYETLVSIDCQDEVHPALAAAWKRFDGGRLWTFTLREGARFWDGSPLTARDVVSSWMHAEPSIVDAVIDSATAPASNEVRVYFKRPRRDLPRELSSPTFAVAKASYESPWWLGSGPYEIVAWQRGARRIVIARPAFRGKSPALRFTETTATDARDVLEGGVDVMVSADPAVVEYAASREQLETAPLPWVRTYVLLSTSRARELWLRNKSFDDDLPDAFADALARDAVRGDARGHRGPSWWHALGDCAGPGEASYPPRATALLQERRILYDAGDPVARDLTERIVALAAESPSRSREAATLAAAVPGFGDGGRVVAQGASASELERSLRGGDDFAYVLALPFWPADRCSEAQRLTERVPWLGGSRDGFGAAWLPLVDTRPHVIVRRGRCPVSVDGYGNILIMAGAQPGDNP